MNNKQVRSITAKIISTLLVAVLLICSVPCFSIAAPNSRSVTIEMEETLPTNYSYVASVYIDSLLDIAALEVSVHYDATKIKINSSYSSAPSVIYESSNIDGELKFTFVYDGKNNGNRPRLFYFYYSALDTTVPCETSFDVTIGEAYTTDLTPISVKGTRKSFEIVDALSWQSCWLNQKNNVSSTFIGDEFELSYEIIASDARSGLFQLSFDRDLFQVVECTPGGFLDGKIYDISTELDGSVYVSFIYDKAPTSWDFITVKFRTIANVGEQASITLRAQELYDKSLNALTCSDQKTTIQIEYDDEYDFEAKEIRLTSKMNLALNRAEVKVHLDEGTHLGAGDFVVTFDPEVFEYDSYEALSKVDFLTVNDKLKNDGILKFSIISLNDIVKAEDVLKLSFKLVNDEPHSDMRFTLSGDDLSDSLTNPIKLNFIDTILNVSKRYALGDVNMDGNVNSRDVTMIKQYVVHMITLTDEQQYYANVYPDYDKEGNPVISSRDATLLTQYVVHMPVKLGEK